MYKHRRLITALFIIVLVSAVLTAAYILRGFFTGADNPDITAQVSPQTPQQTPAADYEQPAPPPAGKAIRPLYADWRSLYNNNDIIGYLRIDGTSIDYPVVQARDNDYYLSHNILKEESAAGWIFLDYENRLFPLDKNTIIYGHNMIDDIMFHALRYYANEDFYRENRYIQFNTAYDDYTWEIFAFGRVPVTTNYLEVSPAPERFEELISELQSCALYDTGVAVGKNDRILNLSTCSVFPAESDYRYVLSARLVR